ncbi:Ctr copper transporter family-domain-containing protein [Limtongia smithiae]|uniref:Ctr copper transporter family-domain-containing protein n=1 Tax=Limtongia smithiae TaxID=1125753 RepID=UPI0034CF025A
MDHTAMDHSKMDHSMHGGGMESSESAAGCKMNMLFTFDSTDLCIVFPWWHIRTGLGFAISLMTVVGLSMLYEYIRFIASVYEKLPGPVLARTDSMRSPSRGRLAVIKAAFYALQVFYSFFIMLIFMTYNGWIMLAVVLGAFAGRLVWSSHAQSSQKGMFCH